VQSVIGERLGDENVHIGPSDYVPWQLDNKIAFIRVEDRLFGDVPMEIDLKLSVEDSPNSAGVAIDAIRCCKLALDRGIGGVLHSASAYFSKHPPVQMTDDEAYRCVEQSSAASKASQLERNEVSGASGRISSSSCAGGSCSSRRHSICSSSAE